MRRIFAECGMVAAVMAASLFGSGAAHAWRVTTSNHYNLQHTTAEADPSLYVLDVVPPEVAAQTQPHVKLVREYVEKNVRPWLSDPVLIDAIKAQNNEHAHITLAQIDKLDAGFIERTDKVLIDSTMNGPLARFLGEKKTTANGVIFEIFVMDNKGLNVAQTDPTLDYMQGDEAKFQKTFLVGPDAVFIDEVAPDGGVNVSQADMSIKDPATGKEIGAVTIGIGVDQLK
jgi:hypothetical protein